MKKISAIQRLGIIIALIALGGFIFFITKHQNQQTPVSPDTQKYADAVLGFSFAYPATFSASSFGEADDSSGKTILLQSAAGEKGMQVLITPFDEDVALTPERIHEDIPDLAMGEVSTRTLGTGGKTAQAVIFESANSSMGESREAWFVYEKRLYQVSAPLTAQDAFTAVLASWAF